MFYDNATMLELPKNSMVDTPIIDVSQLNILYNHCSSVAIKQPFCFHDDRHLSVFQVCKHCRKLFLKMTLDQAYITTLC